MAATFTARATSGRPPIDEKRGIEALYATGHWLMSQDRCTDAASVFRAMALLAPEDERSLSTVTWKAASAMAVVPVTSMSQEPSNCVWKPKLCR